MRSVVLWVSFGIRLMHITRTPLSTDDPFILENVKLHARVSFDDDDPDLVLMARTAAREIEAHCALALMTQIITVTKLEWGCVVPLPIGPLDVVALDDHPSPCRPVRRMARLSHGRKAGGWMPGAIPCCT